MPRSVVLHDVSASYDHARRDLQRRIARNGEILFWSNLPAIYLVAAAMPHGAFLAAQALWRLARGRLRPFAEGKWQALRELPSLPARRRLRAELARSAAGRPHFPLAVTPVGDLIRHLSRS
jgi:hypothetical protein